VPQTTSPPPSPCCVYLACYNLSSPGRRSPRKQPSLSNTLALTTMQPELYANLIRSVQGNNSQNPNVTPDIIEQINAIHQGSQARRPSVPIMQQRPNSAMLQQLIQQQQISQAQQNHTLAHIFPQSFMEALHPQAQQQRYDALQPQTQQQRYLQMQTQQSQKAQKTQQQAQQVQQNLQQAQLQAQLQVQQHAQQQAQAQKQKQIQDQLRAMISSHPEVLNYIRRPEMASRSLEDMLIAAAQFVQLLEASKMAQRKQSLTTPPMNQQMQYAQRQSPGDQANSPHNPMDTTALGHILKLIQSSSITPEALSALPEAHRVQLSNLIRNLQSQPPPVKDVNESTKRVANATSPPQQTQQTQQDQLRAFGERLKDVQFVTNLIKDSNPQRIQYVFRNSTLRKIALQTINSNSNLASLFTAHQNLQKGASPPQVKPETPITLQPHSAPSIPTLAADYSSAILQPLMELKKQPPTLAWLDELDRILFLGQDEELDFDAAVTDLGGAEESTFLAEAAKALQV
jgi:hypothetical protein